LFGRNLVHILVECVNRIGYRLINVGPMWTARSDAPGRQAAKSASVLIRPKEIAE